MAGVNLGEVCSPNSRGITLLARAKTYFPSDEGILCCSAKRSLVLDR